MRLNLSTAATAAGLTAAAFGGEVLEVEARDMDVYTHADELDEQ